METVMESFVIPVEDLELGEPLGDGGVVRGKWVSRGRDVAIKCVATDMSGADWERYREVMARRVEELQRMAVASVGSRHVCPLLGFAVKDSEILAVMPWIEGGSLADRIKERRAGLPPQEVVDVAVQLLEGLRDLHDRGVVHGKVTPGNALVDERGIVMLADYGLASVVGNAIGSLPWSMPRAGPSYGRSTVTGMSSEDFMPPEWRNGRITAASDAYAVAATLCCVASGQLPHGDQGDGEVDRDVVGLQRFPTVPESVPEPLRSALQGALREQPEERPGVAAMLRAARESGLQDCRVCMERVESRVAVACSGGAAHHVCSDCLALKVGTLAESRAASTPAGDLRCRDCTGLECMGAFSAAAVMAKLPGDEDRRGFLDASRRHAAEAEQAERARELEELRSRIVELEAAGGPEAVAAHCKLLQEELNVIRCPRCKRAAMVGDFQACMALTCTRAEGGCGAFMCRWCLGECGEDAHHHVAHCTRNPRRPDLFGTEAMFREQERALHRRKALAYLVRKVPDELRRAVWEAAEGLFAIREARLQWADVEASITRQRLALQEGIALVSTAEELAEAMERGGSIDLGGDELGLTAEIVVGNRVVTTVRNGTLRAADTPLGTGYGLQVQQGAELRLEGMTVIGTGVRCGGGGNAALVHVRLEDAPKTGVMCTGHGSRVDVQGGRIAGSRASDGLVCQDGGQAEVRDVEIADCNLCGVFISGTGSMVVVQRARVVGSKVGHGIACQQGGCAKLRDVEVVACKQSGVYSYGQGSHVTMHGGRITGSSDGNGVACSQRGRVQVEGTTIADCKLGCVRCHGAGSQVVVRGGRISGSMEGHGVLCQGHGHVTVDGVEVADCKLSGVCCTGWGAQAVVQGGRITGCKDGHGVACDRGGGAELREVHIADCRQGVACQQGGHAELREVQIADCAHGGMCCFDEGSVIHMNGGCVAMCSNSKAVWRVEGGKVHVRGTKISSKRGVKRFFLLALTEVILPAARVMNVTYLVLGFTLGVKRIVHSLVNVVNHAHKRR